MCLTNEWVGDVRPVDAVLEFQLVVGLDVEQQVLIEAHARNQVSPVGTLQRTVAVDVLQWQTYKENEQLHILMYLSIQDGVSQKHCC